MIFYISAQQVLRNFYARVKSRENFHCYLISKRIFFAIHFLLFSDFQDEFLRHLGTTGEDFNA